MSRANDLDSVAPDDPVIGSNKAETKKTNKIPASENDEQFWQDVYGLLGHTNSPLSSFLVRPKVLSFEEISRDEKVILALRPHWFTNVAWILTTFFLVLLPFFSWLIPLSIRSTLAEHALSLSLFWYLVTFLYAFEKFLNWYFNLYIITNKRVVDIDFNNLFNKRFSSADMESIEDITYSKIGFVQSLFNYGSITIQTAAEVNEIKFEKISRPDKVVKIIEQLRENYSESKLGGSKNE